MAFTGEVRILEKEYLHVIALGPESIIFDQASATYTLLLTLGEWWRALLKSLLHFKEAVETREIPC